MAQLAAGRDLKFSESRLEGYRNFMNKIWNATRFALGALGDFDPKGGQTLTRAQLSVADQWIISRTQQTATRVNEALEQYRFADAAQALYVFMWEDLCDWYLEFSKPMIYGEPGPERAMTQRVLAETLNRAMRMLHPFVPFISEEIYQKLPIRGEACITDRFPVGEGEREWYQLGSTEAAFEMEIVKQVISALRNIRGENQIKPGVQIKARLAPQDGRIQKILGENKAQIMRLSRLETCEIGEAGSMQKCAVAPVRLPGATIDVIVPLEGLVDIQEEIKRLQKVLEKVQKDIGVVGAKLENENFLKNAPEDLVATERQLLASLRDRQKSLGEALIRLQ
jgi:valyl-tRNA synthetase